MLLLLLGLLLLLLRSTLELGRISTTTLPAVLWALRRSHRIKHGTHADSLAGRAEDCGDGDGFTPRTNQIFRGLFVCVPVSVSLCV